jgi:hypothetical protein
LLIRIPHPSAAFEQGIAIRPDLLQGWFLDQGHPQGFLHDAQLALHGAAGQIICQAIM